MVKYVYLVFEGRDTADKVRIKGLILTKDSTKHDRVGCTGLSG